MANSSTVNPPPSALMASARSPIPLAPRLTTPSLSQGSANIDNDNGNTDAHTTTAASATATPPQASELPSQTDVGQNETALQQGRGRLMSQPRHLLQRASQPLTATQALSIDALHSTTRFAAYLPQQRGTRESTLGTRPNAALEHRPTLRPSADSLSSQSVDDGSAKPVRGPLDARLRAHNTHNQAHTFSVLPQFRPDAVLPGDVLVRCSSTDFYVHQAVLYFASPFFRAILDGDWRETHPSLHSLSVSSECGDTSASAADDGELSEQSPANQMNSLPFEAMNEQTSFDGQGNDNDQARSLLASPRASFHTAIVTVDIDAEDDASPQSSDANERSNNAERPMARLDDGIDDLNERLGRMATPPLPDVLSTIADADGPVTPGYESTLASASQTPAPAQTELRVRKEKSSNPKLTAIIDLSEEDASTFQDVLCHIYPNLDLTVTWLNIFTLFAFADKFNVPYLHRACTNFLRAALAGHPIEAMALSERHHLDDIYREASRHVLDNMPSWAPDELAVLSSETLLKLERKRTWFLERLLKLGLANPARDFECHSACPDPQHCARLLHERWHSQFAAAFKYGPPQPSMIWRHLRELEGSGVHAASTAMSACQAASRSWVQSLFDRMYGLPTHSGKTPQKFLAIKLA